MLAHAQHEHAASRSARSAGSSSSPRLAASPSRCSQPELDRAVGQRGERGRHLLDRPQIREIAQADQQRLPPPHTPQSRHQPGPVADRHLAQLRQQGLVGRIGPLLEQQPQHTGLGHQAIGQEWAAPQHAAQEIVLLGLVCDMPHESGQNRVDRGFGNM